MITPGQVFNPIVGESFSEPVLTTIPTTGFQADTPEFIGIDATTGVLSGTLSQIYSGDVKVSYQSEWLDLFAVPPPSCSTVGVYCFQILGVSIDGAVMSCRAVSSAQYNLKPKVVQTQIAYGDYVQACTLTIADYPQSRSNVLALKSDGYVEIVPTGGPAFANIPAFTVTKIGVRGDHYNQVFWALKPDGTVYEWNRTVSGNANFGVVGGVTVNSNIAKIATNYGVSGEWVIEKTDGSVYSNISGSPALITGIGGTVAELAIGSGQLLILKTDGTVFNVGGYLPPAIAGGSVASISSLGYISAVSFVSGSVLSWDFITSYNAGIGGSGFAKIFSSGDDSGSLLPQDVFALKSDNSVQWFSDSFNPSTDGVFFPRPYGTISFGGVGGTPNIVGANLVIPARQEFEFQCRVLNQNATPASSWNATGLPAGLTISSTGLISGTPTAVGTFTPTISAVGGDGNAGIVVFSIRVVGGLATIVPDQIVTGRVDQPLNALLDLDDISAPPLYFRAVGLPSYMTISDDGTITGTPNKAESFALEISVFSVFGSSTESVNFVIGKGIPEIDPNQKIEAWLDFDLSYFPRLINQTQTEVTAWSAMGLPLGALINTSTGEITWRPTVIETASVAITAHGEDGYQSTVTVPLEVQRSGYKFHGNRNLVLLSHSRQNTDSGLSIVSAQYSCPVPNAYRFSRILQARMALPNFPDHISKDSAAQNIDNSGFAKFSITGFAGRKNISVPVDVPTVFGTQLASVSMTLNRGPNVAPVGYTLRILSDTITKKFTIGETTSMTEIGLPSEPIKFNVFEITNNTTSVSYSSFAEFLQIFAPTFEITAGGTNRRFTTIIPAPETALASLAQLVSLSRANYGEIDEVTATWGLAFSAFEIKAVQRTEFIPF